MQQASPVASHLLQEIAVSLTQCMQHFEAADDLRECDILRVQPLLKHQQFFMKAIWKESQGGMGNGGVLSPCASA